MDSMVPTLSPSRSTMVAPCQPRTVSTSGMCSLLGDGGWVAAVGRHASAVQRRPTDFWLAAPAEAGALPTAGVVQVGRAGPLGGRVLGGPAVAVEPVGLSLGGRGPGLLAQLGAALLVANDQDDQGRSQLGQERGHIRPGVLDAALEVNGEDQVLLLGVRSGSDRTRV